MRRLFVRPRVGAPFPRGLGWGPVSRPLAIRNPHPPGLSVRRRASQLAASKPGTSARNSYLCEPSCPASRLRLLGFADAPRAPLMARGCFLAGLRVLLGHSPRVLFPWRGCASYSDTRPECFCASLRSASWLPRFARHIFLLMTAIFCEVAIST